VIWLRLTIHCFWKMSRFKRCVVNSTCLAERLPIIIFLKHIISSLLMLATPRNINSLIIQMTPDMNLNCIFGKIFLTTYQDHKLLETSKARKNLIQTLVEQSVIILIYHLQHLKIHIHSCSI